MSTATTPLSDKVSLYYKEGTSDKEYHIDIIGNDDVGYTVQYKFGRRGAKLMVKNKNASPTDQATAKALFNKMLNEQLKKGYTYGEDGTPYVGTENQGKVSGIRPVLLNEIDEDDYADYIGDEEWVMQEKKNGVRQMIKYDGKGKIEGINKKGLTTSLPETTAKAIIDALGQAPAVLDGELVGEKFWLFDIISIGVHAFSDKPYVSRLAGIQEWLGGDLRTNDLLDGCFRLVPTAIGKASKKSLFNRLKAENAEGVVFKRKDALYKAGRPASGGGYMKFKFYATATVRVKALNNKNSFQMEMLSKGDWVYVGDCTFYPTKYTPKAGDFVEVRYMYAFPNGSLYGPPVIQEPRTDCDEGDCVLSQLKYKQGTEEEG